MLSLNVGKVAIKVTKNNSTSSGLYIPDSNQSVSFGEVVAVGEVAQTFTGKDASILFIVGQKVIVPNNFGTKVTIDNEDLVILNQTDVMAVINS